MNCYLLKRSLAVLLLSITFLGCSQKEKRFSLRLTEWKIAPVSTAETPALKEIAISDSDEIVKAADYPTDSWINATVPGTVLGNLVDNGIYDYLFEPDNDGEINVYFSSNLSKIPEDDFDYQWWYSTDFTVPSSEAGKRITITFKGISYIGEIYVNGTKVVNKYINITDENFLKNGATLLDPEAEIIDYEAEGAGSLIGVSDFEDYKSKFIGTMRTYDIDITNLIKAGNSKNNIKVKVTKPFYRDDLTYYWVDWNPKPADAMMGLTGEVLLHTSGSVRLSNPAVVSKVSLDHKQANLNLYVDVSNFTSSAVNGLLKTTIKDPDGNIVASIEKYDINVTADAYNNEIELNASVYPELTFTDPRLWWPYLSGDQPLYTADYEFFVDGELSDKFHHRFGIREISSEFNVSPYANNFSDSISASHLSNMLQIYVNHRPILLKGGGYCASDLLLRHNLRTNEAVVEYVKYMGMNMIRDEGKFFDNNLLELMDENGILLMTGWCCCDRWQSPGSFSKAERFVAFESLYAQLRNARQYACMFMWFNGSDDPPGIVRQGVNGQNVEQKYFEIEANLRWLEIGAITSSGSSKVTTLTGLTGGMHMDATYDSQSPTWYYFEPRGIYGFVSEGGGGGSIPIQESIRKILPESNLWPYNSEENYNVWNYHTCRGSFNNLGQHILFIDGSFGASNTFDEFVTRAQIYQYEQQRAQYEAFNYNRYKNTTGIINWMLNNAWPIMFWNQFDFYLNPNGTTYGARKGNEPVHIMYNVYQKGVHIINNTPSEYNGAVATMSVYNIDGKLISTPLGKTIDILSDGVSKAVDYVRYGENRLSPKTIGLVKNSSGEYEPYEINVFGTITDAFGVIDLWNNDEIQASLIEPVSDVYFLRLELKDINGEVISLNSYAVPMRNDIAGASHDWNRSGTYQVGDLTQLNQLPTVELEILKVSSKKIDNKNVLTYRINNPTDKIAYAVELKAYSDNENKTLVAPVFYDDNLFTLFPGESRYVNITYSSSDLFGDAFVKVSCYNNVVEGSDSRVATNIYSNICVGGSNNIARGKPVIGGVNPYNATKVVENGQINADKGNTFIDSDMNTYALLTADDGAFIVDLESVQSFDRLMLRWNQRNNLRGRPNHVRIEVSEDNNSYTAIADYDNSVGSIMINIILPVQAKGRYVKIIPSGLLGTSPAVGMTERQSVGGVFGQSASGVEQEDAPAAFSLSAVEIYSYGN